MTLQEQRKFTRTTVAAVAEIQHPILGTIKVHLKDFSDGGIYALTNELAAYPVGMQFEITVRRVTGQVNIGPASVEVVRHHHDGMGLKFI